MKLLLLTILTFISLQCLSQDTCRYTINFHTDESSLSKPQRKSLDSLLTSLDDEVNYFIYDIQGHTDSIGNRLYNLELSEKRCESVKAYLLKKGVDVKRIKFEKYSFDSPLKTNTSDEGRATNRRARLNIVLKLDAPDWHVKPQIFEIDSKKENTLKTKNACKVIVPAGAFVSSDLQPITGEIEIHVTEYNNPAEFIASGIPMSYMAEGKLFMYHSEEMLSIKAFQNLKPIELKRDIKIILNCKAVDSLYETGFYKFNLQEHKWFEEEKQETIIEANIETPKKKQNKKENLKKENEKVEVSTTPIKKTVDVTEENPKTDTEKNPSGIPRKAVDIKEDSHTLNETTVAPVTRKKDDMEKIQALRIDTGWYTKARIDSGLGRNKYFSPKSILPNCCLARLYIALGQMLSKKPLDLSGLDLTYQLNKNKENVKRYVELELKNSDESLPEKKYYPIRLETKKLILRRKALVKFIYDKEKNQELKALRKVKWIYKFKENTEDYASFKKRKFHDIRVVYDPISKRATIKLDEKNKFCTIILKPKDPDKEIEEKIKNYQKVLTPRILSIYASFWAFNEEFFAKKDKGLTFLNWVNYFNTHLNELHARYDSLNQNIEQVLKNLPCICIPLPPCTICDSISSDTSAKTFLRGSGPNRMLIIGLGMYNYDKVIPIEDVVTIDSPVFLDAKGRKIYPKEIFLLLEGIKGMIRIDNKMPFFLIKKMKNTVFIIDHANRRFKFVIDEDEDLNQIENTIPMKDITSTTMDLKGLVKELNMK